MSHVSDGALHAYLDGEAGERERAEIEEHFAKCETCRERLDEAAAVGRRASELLADLEPAGVRAPSWREIEERASARREPQSRRSWLRPGLAWAASIALAFAIGFSSGGLFMHPGGLEDAALQAPAQERGQPAQLPAVVVPTEREQATGAAAGAEASDEGYRRAAPTRSTETTAEPAAPLGEAKDAAPPVAKAAGEEPVSEPAGGRAEVAADAVEAPAVDRAAEREADLAAEERAKARASQTIPPESSAAVRQRLDAIPAAAMEEARRTAVPQAADVLRQRAAEGLATMKDRESFVAVPAQTASEWLGARLRTLPELELIHVDVGPGSTQESGLAGRPAVRLVYRDAARNEIVLTQQWTGGTEAHGLEPTLVVEPSGLKSYRWFDGGYRLVLRGTVSSDSLRALAARVR